MRKTFFGISAQTLAPTLAAALILSAAVNPAFAQEDASVNLILLPSQERIPQPDKEPVIPPELIIPPIGAAPPYPAERSARELSAQTPAQNFSPFRAPLISGLERGKWYVQIGAYKRADHVEDAISRVGTTSPVVIHNVGTDINPMFRVLLGPFSRSESKTVLQRFRKNGYDAFERNG
jgi:cell division septation protein DedD